MLNILEQFYIISKSNDYTPISMRKSFKGLSNIIEEKFPGVLLSGSFFIFLNRQRDHMKVMFWDKNWLIRRLQMLVLISRSNVCLTWFYRKG
jgi:hypothetical protein